MRLRQPDQTPEAVCAGMKQMNMILQQTAMVSCDDREMQFEIEMKMKKETNLSELWALA